jgi:hypothetical protein
MSRNADPKSDSEPVPGAGRVSASSATNHRIATTPSRRRLRTIADRSAARDEMKAGVPFDETHEKTSSLSLVFVTLFSVINLRTTVTS